MLVRVCTGIVTVAFVVVPTLVQAFSFSDVTHSVGCAIRAAFGYSCAASVVAAAHHQYAHAAQTAAASNAFKRQIYDTSSSSTPPPEYPYTSATSTARTSEQLFVERNEFDRAVSGLARKMDTVVSRLQSQPRLLVQAPISTDAPSSPIINTPVSQTRDYGADIDSLWKALSLTNRIDALGNTSITSPTITGGTITNSTFSGTISGDVSVADLTISDSLTSGSISADILTVTDTLTADAVTASTLTVSGSLSAGTTTTVVLDTHGQVCNVQAYGAKGDNATDNYTAITAAIAACPEAGIVYFPPGVYRISQTIVLDRPITLQGTYAPRWSYSSTPRTSIKPTPTFTGSSIIHVRDRTISGQANDNNGGRLVNISIDGNSYGSNVVGVYFEGLVRDWKIDNVDISQTSGIGFQTAQGDGSGYPRGFTINHLAIYSPASHGFRATALNDSYIEDVLVVGGAQRGFYLTSLGETKINNSRAVFNALEGLYIDGSTNNGGLQFTDFSTDRNNRHGVRISATGTTTIMFNGLLTRRDGKDWNSGSEPPYAGVAVIGQAGSLVAPVVINNLSQIPGVDDTGAGTPSPAIGVRVDYAEYVRVNGILWGITSSYTDGGHNTYFFIEEDSLVKSGFGPSITTTRYNQKWVSSTSTVAYTAGRVGIGTTSPSAQLHTTGTVRFGAFGAGTLQTDANGNVSVSSDERLKNIVGKYTKGLAEILTIRPIVYQWNELSGLDRETLYAGFSAQNVKDSLPEAVGIDTAGFLTLSDRPILAAVVTAVQELWEAITRDRKKIAELEDRVNVLEKALSIQPAVSVDSVSDTTHFSPGQVAGSATSSYATAVTHADDPRMEVIEEPAEGVPIPTVRGDDGIPIVESPSPVASEPTAALKEQTQTVPD